MMEAGKNQNGSKAIQNLFRLLLDPDLMIFINKRKLCGSELLQRAIQVAFDQHSVHRNSTRLISLISFLHGTAEGATLVSRLKPNFEVVYDAGKQPKLRKVSLLEQLAGPAPAQTQRSSAPLITNRIRDVDKSEDLLDSRLMFPGSYGSGRRR
jgi:hypothetical protein